MVDCNLESVIIHGLPLSFFPWAGGMFGCISLADQNQPLTRPPPVHAFGDRRWLALVETVQ
ncbi:hypothetical protein ACO22_06954 [Paracoccidioides brasiliensis]|uniref:Uncharacterized protein n=1 Tax=Paracoccidioides brasiliensis TaxID=121759 RepID=A0A1D2J629_PARBR|nr:hypothetical protein ACO22_06954 [Paracoccidioides brasiliensis]